MKVARWEKKLFNVLVDSLLLKKQLTRKIKSKLNYYYQRLDTQDLVVAGMEVCSYFMTFFNIMNAILNQIL